MNNPGYSLVLCHHGIKGMKWGVRRYQNPDGTLTDVGKKRYYKALLKDVKRNYDMSMPYNRSDSFKQSVKEGIAKANVISSEDKENLYNLNTSYHKALDNYFDNDYYDSEEREKDDAKAYQDTLDWFKKNMKGTLDEFVKDNNGSEENLTDYHDFRKMYEGYQSEAWEQGEKQWNKTHNTKAIEKQLDSAEKAYKDECRRVGNKLLGSYGDQPLSRFSSLRNRTMNDEIADIINSLSQQDWIDRMKNNKEA